MACMRSCQQPTRLEPPGQKIIMSRRSARLAERSSAMRRSPFRFLEAQDLLSLVLGRADLLEHDAFCAALVCRTFRDEIFARFPTVPARRPGRA